MNDFFNINPEIKHEKTLEEKFAEERIEWTIKIANMSAKMKRVFDIPELMTELYSERQRCVEYYHYLISLMIKLNRDYNIKYAERHDYYTNKVQIRYANESSKHNKILADMADLVEKRAIIDNHSKCMDKTISSLDAIIYAISKRVEIEQISRGK